MRAVRIALTVVAGIILYVGSARAQTEMAPVQNRAPHPGASALAATCNIVFMPVRVAVAAIGAELGGIAGWLTAGNEYAAEDIWQLPPFDGDMYLQPAMMYGQDTVDFGAYSFRMHVLRE